MSDAPPYDDDELILIAEGKPLSALLAYIRRTGQREARAYAELQAAKKVVHDATTWPPPPPEVVR